MGKELERNLQYQFAGIYEADDEDNDITPANFLSLPKGGRIYAYGGDDIVTAADIALYIDVGKGNDIVNGAAAYVTVVNPQGNLRVNGAAGYFKIFNTGHGNVTFNGAGGGVKILHSGAHGNIQATLMALHNKFINSGIKGDINVTGVAAYNEIYSSTVKGNINVNLTGGYNQVKRKKSRELNDQFDTYFDQLEKITLKQAKLSMKARFSGLEIQVSAIKSQVENNTYYFAHYDGRHTRVVRVYFYKDQHDFNKSNRVYKAVSAWYKEGDHVAQLSQLKLKVAAHRDLYLDTSPSANLRGHDYSFTAVKDKVAYTLSDIELELVIDGKESLNLNSNNLSNWHSYIGTIIDINELNLKTIKIIDSEGIERQLKLTDLGVNDEGIKTFKGQYTSFMSIKSQDGSNIIGKERILLLEIRNNNLGLVEFSTTCKSMYESKTLHDINSRYRSVKESSEVKIINHPFVLKEIEYSIVNKQTIEHLVVNRVGSISVQDYSKWDDPDNSRDINFEGNGAANYIESDVDDGNVVFKGNGFANVIFHASQKGNTSFSGTGAANVVIKNGRSGSLSFDGVGIANVIINRVAEGDMQINAGGAANVIVRIGDGRYVAKILALANVSVMQGDNHYQANRIVMLGGLNTHTHIGYGNNIWLAGGGLNVATQIGDGDLQALMVGGGNVLTKSGDEQLIAGMIGGANILTHINTTSKDSDTRVIALGGANIVTKQGKGDIQAYLGGGANVLTHVGDGATLGVMLGGANVLTKVGNGDTTGIMFGLGNIFTQIGAGNTIVVMASAGNVLTKVGDGSTIAAMLGIGNILTHVGRGDVWALMGGAGNVFTKINDQDSEDFVLALMAAKGNIFTQVGNGTTIALMLAKGNVVTKVGDGMTIAAMVAAANIYTHVGDGETFAAMFGKANVLTKVGSGLSAVLLAGNANIFTHVNQQTSTTIGLFAGKANIMTKVGDGTAVGLMYGDANIMTHIGHGITGVLALGKVNIITKIGNGFMGVLVKAEGNVITHVGDGTTAAVLLGKANILTKVGDGLTVGLLISDAGNIMTHIHSENESITIGLAKGKANIITKFGNGLAVNGAWGEANSLTHIGDGDRYNFAKGRANIITKVGDQREVTVVQGDANIISHIGQGDDYIGAWGKANIVTKVGDGQQVVLAKGDANVITQVGDGEGVNLLWSKGNIATKVGDGLQVTLAKGKANVTTTIGDGVNVTATYGNTNINTKVGDGTSVNVVWGKYNVNTKVGDGVNVAVMKGEANVNIQLGDGLSVNASYAKNNVIIKVGNGDFYNLSIASSNTQSAKLSALFDNIKQTALGAGGSQAISYLVNGENSSTSGWRKGRGGIQISQQPDSLNGFNLTSSEQSDSSLEPSMTPQFSDLESPDLEALSDKLSVEQHQDAPDDSIRTQLASAPLHQPAIDEVEQNKQQADTMRGELEAEKARQLGQANQTINQLNRFDDSQLKNNGSEIQQKVAGESSAVLPELAVLSTKLAALNDQHPYQGESGQSLREAYAGNIISDVKQQLDTANTKTNQQLDALGDKLAVNDRVINQELAKSESAVVAAEQNQSAASKDLAKFEDMAAQKVEESKIFQTKANDAKTKADAQVAFERDRSARNQAEAIGKTNAQTADEAKALKLDNNYRPDRQGAQGSGLSGNAYQNNNSIEGLTSQISAGTKPADGRFTNQIDGNGSRHFIGLGQAKLAVSAEQPSVKLRSASAAILPKNNSAQNTYQPKYRLNIKDELQLRYYKFGSKIGAVYSDWRFAGKEIPEQSVRFQQTDDLLYKLKKEMIEIAASEQTVSNPKHFLQGICFALSTRYMMEERAHGPGAGTRYLTSLSDMVTDYKQIPSKRDTSVDGITNDLRAQYRRQVLENELKYLINIQDTFNKINAPGLTTTGRQAIEDDYKDLLKRNGLIGKMMSPIVAPDSRDYEGLIASLDIHNETKANGLIKLKNESIYMTFMSREHAMVVTVHADKDNPRWSFFDPNTGVKTFNNYLDFRRYMDNYHSNRNLITLLGYSYDKSSNPNARFIVEYNEFAGDKNFDATNADSFEKATLQGEQNYILSHLKEQQTEFEFNKIVTGRVVDYSDDQIILELTTKNGRKIVLEVESQTFGQATKLVQPNLNKILLDSNVQRLSIKPAQLTDDIQLTVLQRESSAADINFKPDQILDKVIRDLNRSSTLLSETDFFDNQTFAPQSVKIRQEWEQTLRHINAIRDKYFPHDMASYFAALKEYRVGNCGDRALYAAHFIMNEHGYQGEVELLKLKGSGDHVFVKIGGNSGSALVIDPWTGQYFPYSEIDTFLYNPKNKKVEVHRDFSQLQELFEDLPKVERVMEQLDPLGPKRKFGLKLDIPQMTPLEQKRAEYERRGILVASGSFGLVIKDPDNPNVLIKDMGQARDAAEYEKKYFNQFYGEGSAEVYHDAEGNVFLKMLKVPGVPVSQIPVEQLPADMQKLYLEMTSELDKKNILHQDLHASNILYDVDSQRFYPVDFESCRDIDPNNKVNHQLAATQFEQSVRPTDNDMLQRLHNTRWQNSNVDNWSAIIVTPNREVSSTNYDSQVIIQLENDVTVAKSAANLAAKHPTNSVVVQLDTQGQYRVVYGDPMAITGNVRWQLVGHGREPSAGQNNLQMAGHDATSLATRLAQFDHDFNGGNADRRPKNISIVGCSLVNNDKRTGFARGLMQSLAEHNIHTSVSARNSDVAVGKSGRKYTMGENGWDFKRRDHKTVLSWNENGQIVSREELIRHGTAESDIDIRRVGMTPGSSAANGAIGNNQETFSSPKKTKKIKLTLPTDSEKHLSYSGNIALDIGDGEFTSVNWGTTNVGIKVGTGGFKSLAFGDNNVMIHVGNGDSEHSVNIGGYQAFEGAQLFIGTRNISFNLGRSNDLIVMAEKSIPVPTLVNPFDGSIRMNAALEQIANSGRGENWLLAQSQQWTLAGANKYLADMAGLDSSSSVDYQSLTELDSHNKRSSRGLNRDIEATLNKRYNRWLSGGGNQESNDKLTRAEKFRRANEKMAFNFSVAGQGADIQVTHGNWNVMFGDNIQSVLDTNIGSLFGIMTQQYSATGQPQVTFTYTPTDLPRQLRNRLFNRLASVSSETTLGDIFGVTYTADGRLISTNGKPVNEAEILTELAEILSAFGGENIKKFSDPEQMLNSLQANLNMGKDGVQSFVKAHGLATLEEDKSDKDAEETDKAHTATASAINNTPGERNFGFNSLDLPNVFATIFSKEKQTEMSSKMESMQQAMSEDLLNMEQKTLDFLRNSGYLQGDGDLYYSMGNYNFYWGGDGHDVAAMVGDNNNFWAGRGDDAFYATGISNIFSGGEGNDTGILTGLENMMFGGQGDDVAVVAGRINNIFMGEGQDQAFVFGEEGYIELGAGHDYAVISGNANQLWAGNGQDYIVLIGNYNKANLGDGDDFATILGNYSEISAGNGHDAINLVGYRAIINGEAGRDFLIADSVSKYSQLYGGKGRDILTLGGYKNQFYGGEETDSFIVNSNIIDNDVKDISHEDFIVFDGIDLKDVWLERQGDDLYLSTLRADYSDNQQQQFERIGTVRFDNYFAGNRAKLVISAEAREESDERDCIVLQDDSVDKLVQVMSNKEFGSDDSGLLAGLDDSSLAIVDQAWQNVTTYRAMVA